MAETDEQAELKKQVEDFVAKLKPLTSEQKKEAAAYTKKPPKAPPAAPPPEEAPAPPEGEAVSCIHKNVADFLVEVIESLAKSKEEAKAWIDKEVADFLILLIQSLPKCKEEAGATPSKPPDEKPPPEKTHKKTGMGDKKLTFIVKGKKGRSDTAPRWRQIEVENADCPTCKRTMMVAENPVGNWLYGYCYGCRQYFLGE